MENENVWWEQKKEWKTKLRSSERVDHTATEEKLGNGNDDKII